MNLAKMGWTVAATIALSTVWAAAEQFKVDVFNWYIATSDQSKAMRVFLEKYPELFDKNGQEAKITGNIILWKTSNSIDIDGDWKLDIATIDWVKYEDSSCGKGECTAATPFAKD